MLLILLFAWVYLSLVFCSNRYEQGYIICMCLCFCVYTCVCMHLCVFWYIFVYMCTSCMCVHLCMCECWFLCMCLYLCVFCIMLCACAFVCVCACVCVCVRVRVCVCVCVCVCVHVWVLWTLGMSNKYLHSYIYKHYSVQWCRRICCRGRKRVFQLDYKMAKKVIRKEYRKLGPVRYSWRI